MSNVLRMKDRVKIDIGDISFYLAPMNRLQKQEISNCRKTVAGEDELDLTESQALYMKYSIKDVKGLTNYDGSPYELEFEGDYLTDDCVSEILNLEVTQDLIVSAWRIYNGIAKDASYPKGVEVEVVPAGKLSTGAAQKTQ